jgi:hypothetical protein
MYKHNIPNNYHTQIKCQVSGHINCLPICYIHKMVLSFMNNGAKLLVFGHYSQSPQFGMYSDSWGYSSLVSLCIS